MRSTLTAEGEWEDKKEDQLVDEMVRAGGTVVENLWRAGGVGRTWHLARESKVPKSSLYCLYSTPRGSGLQGSCCLAIMQPCAVGSIDVPQHWISTADLLSPELRRSLRADRCVLLQSSLIQRSQVHRDHLTTGHERSQARHLNRAGHHARRQGRVRSFSEQRQRHDLSNIVSVSSSAYDKA